MQYNYDKIAQQDLLQASEEEFKERDYCADGGADGGFDEPVWETNI